MESESEDRALCFEGGWVSGNDRVSCVIAVCGIQERFHLSFERLHPAIARVFDKSVRYKCSVNSCFQHIYNALAWGHPFECTLTFARDYELGESC